MTGADLALALIALLAATIAGLIRELWKLNGRVSRLEGRLNGNHRE